jgi:hypothetical protein
MCNLRSRASTARGESCIALLYVRISPSHKKKDLTYFYNPHSQKNKAAVLTMSEATFSPSNQQDFDDAIHQLVNSTRRPKKDGHVSNLENLLTRLIDLCGHDSNRWKLLVLAVTYKRYHLLSPQAKEEGRDSYTAGEGERRIFYTAVRVLFAAVMPLQQGIQVGTGGSCQVGSSCGRITGHLYHPRKHGPFAPSERLGANKN